MKRKFDKDLRLESVKLVLDNKLPVAPVARKIGIHENTLRKWICLFRDHQENAFPGNGNLRPEEAERMKLGPNSSRPPFRRGKRRAFG